jgi:hypothetical protein
VTIRVLGLQIDAVAGLDPAAHHPRDVLEPGTEVSDQIVSRFPQTQGDDAGAEGFQD